MKLKAFDEFSGLAGKFLEKFEKDLERAGFRENAGQFLFNSMQKALLYGIASWLVLGLFSGKIVSSFIQAFCISILAFGFFLTIPKSRLKKTASLIERDLPFALLSMSAELNMGISFEKCLKNISNGNYGIVSKEFGFVVLEIFERGKSVQDSLRHFGEKIDSIELKRAIAQLVNVYERGGRKECGNPVKSIALEILSKQKSESKEFSGKIVVFSLMFIAVSAIVPAIFQAFIVVGSFFLKINFTPLQAILIVCVGFPLVDLAIFYYIKSKTPAFLEG